MGSATDSGVCSGCVQKPVIATIVQKRKPFGPDRQCVIRPAKSTHFVCGLADPFRTRGTFTSPSAACLWNIQPHNRLILCPLLTVTDFCTYPEHSPSMEKVV